MSLSEPITVLNNKTIVLLHHAFNRITTSVDTFRYLQQINDTLIFTSSYFDAHFTYDSESDTIKYNFNHNLVYWNYRYLSKAGIYYYNMHSP